MFILFILFSVGRDVKYLSGIQSGLLGFHLMHEVTKKQKVCTVQGGGKRRHRFKTDLSDLQSSLAN